MIFLAQHSTEQRLKDAKAFREFKIGHFFYLVAVMVLTAAVLILLVLAYWSNKTYTPLVYKQGYLSVEPSSLKITSNGAKITVSGEYCRDNSRLVSVNRTMVGDRIQISLPYNDLSPVKKLSPGCGKSVRTVDLPKVLNTGQYHIVYTAIYQVNPIRQVTVTTQTENFTILPSQEVIKGDE